jgi:CubicO group peptidase (beta-lactamase class C family)
MNPEAALRSHLAEGVEQSRFAGASALVSEEGRVLFEAEAGDSRVEPRTERAPAGSETLWDLASLTKPIAGTALVLALAERRLLSLEDEVARFDDLWKKTKLEGVTLRRLLAHTGGIVDWFPLYAKGEGREAYRRALAGLDPEGPPGRKVVYSCPGFLLLAGVVERVWGSPVDVAFRERVAGPLGLSKDLLFSPEGEDRRRAAGGESDDATEREKVAALGLRYAGFRSGVVNGEVNDGNALRRGSGVSLNAGLFGTTRAVAATARAWLERDARLLSESSVAEAVRCQTEGLNEDRGLGWALARSVGSAGDAIAPESFGHTGFTGSSLFVDPRSRRIYVFLANRLHPEARSAAEMIAFRRRFHALAAALP